MPRKLLLIFTLFMALALPGLAFAEQAEPQKKAQKTAKSAGKVKKTKKLKKAKKTKQAASMQKKPTGGTSAKIIPAPVEQKKPAAENVEQGAAPALVKEMRHWSNPDYTRIAVTLDHEVKFEYHRLPENREKGVASRLYIDIDGAKIAPDVKDIPIGDGLLKTARIGQYRPETVRVVLDLDSIREYKVFTFADPFRIIIDAKGERQTEISKPKEASLAPLPALPAIKPDSVAERAKGTIKPGIGKIRRIVVDPGHGGHDPGAIGAGGTREKDVVLQIALRLAHKLREDLGLDVVLTRSTDVFLELQERTAIANQVGADLFVSIHANASLNRNTSGMETYYLNLAKTEKVAQLAAKENGTSLEKVSLLQAVLFDLMANYKLNDSAHLADEVQKALYQKVSGSYSGVKNLGVKQGPFYVLVGATMPSILVETAFVSNDREEARLKEPDYQQNTAEGILSGIREYMASLK
jgi:N-acetylmuramoyl-L-alanine amidase